MLRRRKVESKKQYKKRLRANANAKTTTKPTPSLGAYNWSTTDQSQKPTDCVLSTDESFMHIYDKHTNDPISWKARFQKRRRNIFQRVDIDLGLPRSMSESSGDQSHYYNSDEDGFPLSPPGSTPHGCNSPVKGRSPPGKHTPTKSRRRGTFEIGSMSVENSILDHEQEKSPTKITRTGNKQHSELPQVLGRQEVASSRSARGSHPHSPARTTRSFACCALMGEAEPPGITIEEEKRLWREAIEQEIRDEQRARRSVDTGRDIDQIEVVAVNRDIQDDNHRVGLKYAEMDGVGMVFAPAAAPGKEPEGWIPRDHKPWWRQENWTDSSFRDTFTEMTETDAGYSADRTCEEAKIRMHFHTSRQTIPRDDTEVQSKSLLEQSRNARSKTYRGKRIGLRIDTSHLDGSQYWSTNANAAGKTKIDNPAQHDASNTESPYTWPQSKIVSNARLATAANHRPFTLARTTVQPFSSSLLQQSKMTKSCKEKEGAIKPRQSPVPHIEDTSFSDLDESLDQRIARLDQLKIEKRDSRQRDQARDAPPSKWIACKIYDATPAHSNLEHSNVPVSHQLPSLTLPKLNHALRASKIEDVMGIEGDVLVDDCVQEDSFVNSDSDFSSVVHRMEMTHRAAETHSRHPSERRVEIKEDSEVIPPAYRKESEQSSPVVLRGRPPYFGMNLPGTKARLSSSAGLSRVNTTSLENDTEIQKGTRGKNASRPIETCVDCEFIDENTNEILGKKNVYYDSSQYLDPRPQKKQSQFGKATEPIKILSPVGYYGDPPVLKKTDGSPIPNPRTPQMRYGDRTIPQEPDLETHFESELQHDELVVKEFEDFHPKLIDLMATLSPKNETGGNQENSGVLLFHPTINIYSGRYSETKSTHKNTTDSIEGVELNDPKYADVNNESPIWRSTRTTKPPFATCAADSKCENIGTIGPSAIISDARLGWRKNAVKFDDGTDDDNMHMELQKLAESEMKLRKELEDVHQRNAEYRWKSHCRDTPDRVNGRSIHPLISVATSKQNSKHENNMSRIAQSDIVRRNAMKARTVQDQQIDLGSQVIDLSCVDEDPVLLSPLSNQMSPKTHFEVADLYCDWQEKYPRNFFDADTGDTRKAYRTRPYFMPHTDPMDNESVPKASIVEISRAMPRGEEQVLPDSIATGGRYVGPRRQCTSIENHHDPHLRSVVFSPDDRIDIKDVVELHNNNLRSSPHIHCYDKISTKRRFSGVGSPIHPLQSQRGCSASESPSAFSSYTNNFGVSHVEDATLKNKIAAKGDRVESSEPHRTRNANILIDRELSWGALEHLYKLTPFRDTSDVEILENEILDSTTHRAGLFRSSDGDNEDVTMTGFRDGEDSDDMSMASGDARLLALLSRYHSPDTLERLINSSDSDLNTGNDDDTPPTSNTAFDPESVHRRNMLLIRHGFKQSNASPSKCHVGSPQGIQSLSPSAGRTKHLGQSNSTSKGEGVANEHSKVQNSVSNVRTDSFQRNQHQVSHVKIDSTSCLSPSNVCLSPASRLERLRRLQSKMVPGLREEHRSGPIDALVDNSEEDRKVPMTRRLLSGARQRASKSLRRQSGTLTSSVSPSPKSPAFLEKSPDQVPGAKLSQGKLKKKNYGKCVSRDMQSIASSTDRSKELIHSMSTAARSRHVAAAKPGSLLWEATAARESLLKK